MRDFEKFELNKKKEEKEKERRQRLKQMNIIRKDEKEKVIAEIESKANDKIKYIAVDEKVCVPMINIDDLYDILQEIKNKKTTIRKFN